MDSVEIEEIVAKLKYCHISLSSNQPRAAVASLFETHSAKKVAMVLSPLLFQAPGESDEDLKGNKCLPFISSLLETNRRFLEEVSTAVKDEARRLQQTPDSIMIVTPELLSVLVAQLQSNNTRVAENISVALVACNLKLGLDLCQATVVALRQGFEQYWEAVKAGRDSASSSTVCVRYANTLADLAVADDAFMRVCLDQNVAEAWSSLLTFRDDPLLQITALDLYKKIADSTPYHETRCNWLLSLDSSPLESILRLAGSEGESDPFLGGSALGVVSSVCKILQVGGTAATNQVLLDSFQRVLSKWKEHGSELDRLSLVDAISSFTSAADSALISILNDPVTTEAWLTLGTKPKLKAAVLVSVSQVLDVRHAEADDAGSMVRRRLFATIGKVNQSTSTMDLLMSLLKSPIPEIRQGSYAVLEAMAKIGNGSSQVLIMHPEFLPHILSRDVETSVDGVKAKYAVVEAVVADTTVMGLLSDGIIAKLRTFVDQGAHYMQSQSWEVATE